MLFTPFIGKEDSIPNENSDRSHETAARQRGIKKWLSLKVNIAHRHVENTSASPELLRDRRSLGISPCMHVDSGNNGRGSDSSSNHSSSKNRNRRSAVSTQKRARNRLSVPVTTRRLHRKESGYVKEIPVDIDALPAILEFDYDSPIPSPDTTPAAAPPPTIDHKTDFEDEVNSDSDCSINSTSEEDNGRAPRQRPPLRKRSLIYAMYCTAQPDKSPVLGEAVLPDAETCMQQPTQPWQQDSQSITSANNGSTTFLSCRSMPSINSSQESVYDTSTQSVQCRHIQPASDMSIGFMMVDAPEHLAAARRQQRNYSDACSLTNPEDAMTSTRSSRSSSTSSNISCAEHQVVEAAAYRCNSRYAPRLSTIERAQDGRLLLKPNISAQISYHSCDINGESVSAADSDMWQHNQDLYSRQAEADDNVQKHRQLVQSASLEEFPLVPRLSLQRRAVDSTLFQATELSEDTMNVSLDERKVDNRLLRFSSEDADSEKCINSSDVVPTDTRPFTIITPPDSPDKSNVTTANTSMDTAVSTNTKVGSNSGPSHRTGECFYGEAAVPEAAPQLQKDTATHVSDSYAKSNLYESMEPAENFYVLETVSHDNYNAGMDSHTTSAINPQPLPRSASLLPPPSSKYCKPHATYNVPSYDYVKQLTDSTCGESYIVSDASDTFDPDFAYLPPDFAYTQQGLASQHVRQSLLFGNSHVTSVPAPTIESDYELIPPQLDSKTGSINRDSAQMRSVDMEDIPLADIAMLIPTEECFQQTKSHSTAIVKSPVRSQQALVPSKTRKLATALVKAAQLDGIRSIHRKIRPVGQFSSNGARRSRGNSKVSECSSCSIQCKASEANPPLPPLRKQPSKKEFRFNELVAVYETWNRDEYDRRGMPSTKLDSELIEKIKNELNEYKTYEMCVHEGARENTHFIC
ncbi:hypothetical protein COEREDRAFT_95468 [Coemansia reversa NRRL 1564]|uniref:Uncharacterized protein n=1 Tax=Coemansia reversa (strain ATCC 12441 / NRRL 1564) TaxID=763665 RepID=A0A2G5BJY9_COERN|nr:hypothetical protein COEREDRAFT_95468 [Coemansia reversa NRRL 1564]|eukprot:PIA19328.1 hypothetical protein COEREDRAFT_95468 [Coemansia reversa NRRL 1564]